MGPYLLLLFCLLSLAINAEEPSSIFIDMRDPEYCDGTLSTHSGAVISAPQLRLQAQRMRYSRDPTKRHSDYATAEGNVRLNFYGHLLIGSKIEYNFLEHTGILYDGRTSFFPWFFGGKVIQLCSDGSYIIHNGFATTSQSAIREWEIGIEKATLHPNQDFSAKNITLRFLNRPCMWLPSIHTNIDTLKNSPIKYSMRWGGRQGSRIGFSYDLFKWGPCEGLIRFDYNLKRGLGLGFESHYNNPEECRRFDSINYFAKDSSLDNPDQQTRYRFQGHYTQCWNDNKTLLHLFYDKLSDHEMASDYRDRGMDIEISRDSHLILYHRQNLWIGSLSLRPRINPFQTVKQELPSLTFSLYPRSFSKAIFGFNGQLSYLDFSYAHGLCHVHDFTATRCELRPYLFLPLRWRQFKITPRADYIAIFYGNAPERSNRWLVTELLHLDVETNLYRSYSTYDHSVTPYVSYSYITHPSLPPSRHFIFDSEDGWYGLQSLRIGVRQQLIENARPIATCNSYLLQFIGNGHHRPAPRAVCELYFCSQSRLDQKWHISWDLRHQNLLQFNFRNRWTISDSAAISLEYRQRSAYAWRKLQQDNFALEFYHSEKSLLHSPLSDARRTLLLHFYLQLRYDVALEWESRFGWNRRNQRHYLEFDLNLHTSLPASWKLKLAYQHKEFDDRVAIYFSLGLPHADFAPASLEAEPW